MTDQVLLVSRIALLALVYLVFLRVARAIVVEIRAENGTPPVRARRKLRPVTVGSSTSSATPPVSPPQHSTPLTAASHGLVIRSPKSAAGQSFAITGETTIGRASGCAVLIDDGRVSKIHARLYPDGDRWMLEDLGSTNGTTLNGQRIDAPRPLGSRDIIQVGDVAMEFT